MNAKAPIGQFLINGNAGLLFYFIFVLTVDTCLVQAMLEEGMWQLYGGCNVVPTRLFLLGETDMGWVGFS